MRLSWKLSSWSLSAHMTLILLTGLLVAQGVTTWLQWTERTTVVNQLRGLNGVDRVAEVVRALEFQTPERRADALAASPRAVAQRVTIRRRPCAVARG